MRIRCVVLATAMMPTGGGVTVIRTYPAATSSASQQYPEIYDYIGVKAGEQLHVGHVLDDITTPNAIDVLVPAPAPRRARWTACASCTRRAATASVSSRRRSTCRTWRPRSTS